MTINLTVPKINKSTELKPRISVIGVGGAGGEGDFPLPAVATILAHRVVVATLVTAGKLYNNGVPRGHFDTIIFDETWLRQTVEALETSGATRRYLMIDTAGWLQNRADLMEELAKIVRVIRKKDPDAPHNTLLVLDATTGQNALNQVETFRKLADVSGLVMTKLDGTAKGGVLVALADRFGLPIHAIGVGEQIDDLAPFDPEEFAAALTGLDP